MHSDPWDNRWHENKGIVVSSISPPSPKIWNDRWLLFDKPESRYARGRWFIGARSIIHDTEGFFSFRNLTVLIQGINQAVPGEPVCLKQSGRGASPVRNGYRERGTKAFVLLRELAVLSQERRVGEGSRARWWLIRTEHWGADCRSDERAMFYWFH